jgi:hypothetical protein
VPSDVMHLTFVWGMRYEKYEAGLADYYYSSLIVSRIHGV